MVNQNTNINIRIPKYLKNKFVEVTKKQQVPYSKVLRNMMKEYIAQYNTGGQDDR